MVTLKGCFWPLLKRGRFIGEDGSAFVQKPSLPRGPERFIALWLECGFCSAPEKEIERVEMRRNATARDDYTFRGDGMAVSAFPNFPFGLAVSAVICLM
ncbi:hypothetical protein CEXT_162841 [Caerostris extrusa]|uniref:Uncharacterized protein n=1 Tax=Caerostris extrusa TaxID=172846 RepID=A0AAV4XP70_CAEEX|nr:hypothetical protein CEXT_162841 [Caerostris extrusa]